MIHHFKAKYNIGSQVLCRDSNRKGTIIKVWKVLTKKETIEGLEVEVKFSYTVCPIVTSYNNFKVEESSLSVIDENGIAF